MSEPCFPTATALPCTPASLETITRIWGERWGLPIVTPLRSYLPTDVEGLVLLGGPGGDPVALVTFQGFGDLAEIVTLDALVEGRGCGSRLLAEAERLLASRGVRRLTMITTNDNPRAFGLYVRRGFRLVRVRLDALRAVRAAKPSVPEVGLDGIPLRDLWELEKLFPVGVGVGEGAERRVTVSSGSPFEAVIGFSRAVRADRLVAVSGTAPIGEDGKTVGVGSLYAQTRRCFEISKGALERAGARLEDVIRTRVYLTDVAAWREAARAHAELFGAVRPAATFLRVAGFLDPEWLVETEVDAWIAERT
jgi:enamine deaminase RidA (YjgF/YER057c/UK114 family)/GNAT superfamily N-acetyltransferase